MESNITNKKLVIVSVLIAVILTSVGVAFGYFVWNSTTNTDISFTVEGAVVQLDDGSDITGANLMPVASYTSGGKNVVKKDIKIKLKDTTTDTVTVDFKLKVNSIDSGLNHSSFMYNLVNASGTSVKSGNFSTSKAGDTISLLTLSTTDGSLTTSLTIYTLYIYIDGASGDNPSSMQNQSFDMSFIVEGTNSSREKPETAVAKIEKLDDGTTGDSGSGVYKVSHDAIASDNSATGSEIPAVIDYRYYGASPDNYVCLDMNSESTCPDRSLYRIIGSIYEENSKTNLLKVIKATPIMTGSTFAYLWNSDGTNIWATPTNGNYSNSLTNGASLMILLNSGAWWNSTNDYDNYGLTETIKSMINTSRYYLGGWNNLVMKTSIMYEYERGKNRYDSNRPLYWDGYVGLIYPSDLGYASGNACVTGTDIARYINDNCSDNNWNSDFGNINFLMTPNSSSSDGVFRSFGGIATVGYMSAVFPVFYLTSDVSITSGTGTSTDPYIVTK